VITFTSASTVRNFLAAVGGAEAWLAHGSSRPRAVSIGPVTSDELRRHGLEPDVEAQEHDIDGLVAAIMSA
jgi:uroporphyrinogen-III synthase